jgi:hypothetical protein
MEPGFLITDRIYVNNLLSRSLDHLADPAITFVKSEGRSSSSYLVDRSCQMCVSFVVTMWDRI